MNHQDRIARCRICFQYRLVGNNLVCNRCSQPSFVWMLGFSNEKIQSIQNDGVYMMYASEIKKFKIGVTSNLANRFQQLKYSVPVDLRVIQFWATNEFLELERGLHNMLALYRIPDTEWFDLPRGLSYRIYCKSSSDLMAMINKRFDLI